MQDLYGNKINCCFSQYYGGKYQQSFKRYQETNVVQLGRIQCCVNLQVSTDFVTESCKQKTETLIGIMSKDKQQDGKIEYLIHGQGKYDIC